MNSVYQISLPKNDFEGGMADPIGQFTIPSFDCPSCGCFGARPQVWYASLQPASPEAQAFCRQAHPEKVSSPQEYLAFCDEVRKLFHTKARLLPGSFVGAHPLAVKNKAVIGGLNGKKLRDEIAFIWGGLFNCVVSGKVLGLLEDCGLHVPAGAVVFKTHDREFSNYKVLEIEPQPVWTTAERANYHVSLCNVCGSSSQDRRGTFRMKQFDGAIFRNGFALVRGIEANGIYINQALFDVLSKEKLTGASFQQAGEWV